MNKCHLLLLTALLAQLPAPLRANYTTLNQELALQLPKKPKPLEKAPTSVFIIGTLIKENASFLGLSLGSVAAMAAGWYLLHKYHTKPATPQPNPVLVPTPPAAPQRLQAAPAAPQVSSRELVPDSVKNADAHNLHVIQYAFILMLVINAYVRWYLPSFP